MNIAELAENEIRTHGEHVNVVYEGQEFTNVQMGLTSRRLGNALKKLGIRTGDRVMIQMPNSPEVLQSFQALFKIGAVVVPINYLIGDEESAHIYRDCGAQTIITSSEFLPRVEAARANAPDVKNVILIDKEVPPGYFSFPQLVEGSSDELETMKTADDDLAVLVYTAGTTGVPKGAMHSHHGLYSNARMVNDTLPLPEGGVTVWVLPLCHIYGIASLNAGVLRGGGKAIILRSFDVERLLESIEKYRGTQFAGVPTMYVYMLLYPEPGKYDLSSMLLWVSAAAPLSLETWKEFKEKFGFEIIEGWGLTESGASGCINRMEGPIKVGSAGKPLVGTQVRVVDDDGKELPHGYEGELIIKSPAVMKGYWNKPAETADVLREGWVHTGDVGYLDADGFFFITDRKKDIIIKGGENIHPRDVEEVIFAHPKVSEAAVVGINDDIYGEDIRAFVVLKPGEAATCEEIIEHCCARLKKFKSPKDVRFVDALPKNLMGKVLRKELRVHA